MEKEFLTIEEARKVAGVSRRTMYLWINSGKVAYKRTISGAVRIRADSLWGGEKKTCMNDNLPPITHKASWARFLRERHLLIREWASEGKSFGEIARLLSMDPVQVQLICLTPIPESHDRYAL